MWHISVNHFKIELVGRLYQRYIWIFRTMLATIRLINITVQTYLPPILCSYDCNYWPMLRSDTHVHQMRPYFSILISSLLLFANPTTHPPHCAPASGLTIIRSISWFIFNFRSEDTVIVLLPTPATHYLFFTCTTNPLPHVGLGTHQMTKSHIVGLKLL